MFPRAGQLLPLDIPLMRDPKFQRDRQQFNGRSWDSAQMAKNRPEAAAHIRDAFEFLETTLLADGRDWILKTEKPSLADIEGACVVRIRSLALMHVWRIALICMDGSSGVAI